jgi:DNA polymerase-3 subunit delta'
MSTTELHAALWQSLQQRRQQLPHALLLTGPRGLGKFALARDFAASLLCEQNQANGRPCGQCLACNWYQQNHHPDFRLLQPDALADVEENSKAGTAEEGKEESAKGAESGESATKEAAKKGSQQITIDQVRGLEDFLRVGTHRQGLRLIVIAPAEAMNRSTANALLKTLEEPLPGTLFLLVSHEPERLLPTIRSRCQCVPVAVPTTMASLAWLQAQSAAQPERWLALAGGAPLLALELSRAGGWAILELLLAQLKAGGALDPLTGAAALEKALKAEKMLAPLKRAMEWAQKWVFDLALAQAQLPVRYFVTEQATIQALARDVHPYKLLRLNRKTIQSKRHAEHPLNMRLFLEDFLMSYADLYGK